MTEKGNATEVCERWTADELMGKGSLGDLPSNSQSSPEKRLSFRVRHGKTQDKLDPADWGRPGHLTQEEVDVYVSELFVVCRDVALSGCDDHTSHMNLVLLECRTSVTHS